mgnify:CR=1 FL=1
MIGKLFGRRSNNGFKMRYSSSERQWQVYSHADLIFVGSKSSCDNFILNSNMAFQKV